MENEKAMTNTRAAQRAANSLEDYVYLDIRGYETLVEIIDAEYRELIEAAHGLLDCEPSDSVAAAQILTAALRNVEGK